MNSQIIGILLVLRPWLGTKLESWMKAIRLPIWSNYSQGVQFSPYLLIPASTRSSPQQRSTLLACSPSLSGSNDRSPAAAASQRQNASLCVQFGIGLCSCVPDGRRQLRCSQNVQDTHFVMMRSREYRRWGQIFLLCIVVFKVVRLFGSSANCVFVRWKSNFNWASIPSKFHP